jgi:hypothetical protein
MKKSKTKGLFIFTIVVLVLSIVVSGFIVYKTYSRNNILFTPMPICPFASQCGAITHIASAENKIKLPDCTYECDESTCSGTISQAKSEASSKCGEIKEVSKQNCGSALDFGCGLDRYGKPCERYEDTTCNVGEGYLEEATMAAEYPDCFCICRASAILEVKTFYGCSPKMTPAPTPTPAAPTAGTGTATTAVKHASPPATQEQALG